MNVTFYFTLIGTRSIKLKYIFFKAFYLTYTKIIILLKYFNMRFVFITILYFISNLSNMADNGQHNEKEEVTELKNDLQNASLEEESSDPPEKTPEREITQTDHLNKRLLGAFLDRININPSSLPRNSVLQNGENTHSDTEDTDESNFEDK